MATPAIPIAIAPLVASFHNLTTNANDAPKIPIDVANANIETGSTPSTILRANANEPPKARPAIPIANAPFTTSPNCLPIDANPSPNDFKNPPGPAPSAPVVLPAKSPV